MTRSWLWMGRVGGLAALGGGLAGCGIEGPLGTGTASESDGTTASSTVGIPTTGDETSSPTGGVTDPGSGTIGGTLGGTDATSTTDGSSMTDPAATGTTDPAVTGTTGPEVCMGSLCGEPVTCCTPDEECVEQKCLPTCPSGVRCGENLEICCDAGDVCSGDSCVTPGKDCVDAYDCDPGQYCEPVLGKCLPQPDPLMCQVVPDFEELNVKVEWSWEAEQVLSSPGIADLNGDGIPEVVANTTKYMSNDFTAGIIVALDGATGAELWRIVPDPAADKYGSHGRSTVAVGDVSGDELPDIIYAGRPDGNGRSRVHAVDGTGKLLWTARTPANQPAAIGIANGAATLANFDDDPQAEIVFGASLFDHDGLLVWSQGNNAGHVGAPADYPGGISAVVDVDGDGKPEIVTGKQAWNVDWQPGNPPVVTVAQRWINNGGNGSDGWPAIADLDANGTPEVVIAAAGQLRVIDGSTGKLWCGVDPTGAMCDADEALRTKAFTIPGNGLGGPPTVADFDGDGRPEVAVAAASAYTVFDFNREGEEIVKPMNDPAPAAGAVYRRWSKATQDQSSNVTGSSVFDFQGDGAAEVVYADECYMRVYSGADGAVLLQVENSSATIHEYPLVADVDGDGNSEIVVVANNVGSCNAQGYKQRKGVFLYGDAGDGWVPTRRVWTQHTYHVTNATSAGNVPMSEQDNWTAPGLNNYRQNVQGEGVFNAADLTVDLSVGLDKCADELVLVATVYNQGALGVQAGVVVDFYLGADATGTLLGSQVTDKALLPGGSVKISLTVPAPAEGMTSDYFVEVDQASAGNGAVVECDEENNSAKATEAGCLIPK